MPRYGAFPADHAVKHEDTKVDEVNVGGLSGLLADDQHVVDAEVLAVAAALVHAGRHENTGADEINVGGLSGVLTDPQPPAEHAHTTHTNRARTLPLIPFGAGTGTESWEGLFRVWMLNNATETAFATFQIPVGWLNFGTAIIGILVNTTGTFDWTVDAEQLDAGEATGTDTDQGTANGQAATDVTLLELDVSAALDGLTLAVGDWVGIRFTLDVLTTTIAIRLVGLSIAYESDQ